MAKTDLVPTQAEVADAISPSSKKDPYPKLLPWQRVYAAWVAQHDKLPVQSLRLAEAKTAAGYQVKKRELLKLEARADFRAFLSDLHADVTQQARSMYQADMTLTIQQHLKLRDIAYNEGDYKEHLRYATPVIDRIWPKDDKRAPGNTQVIIQMGVGSFAQREAPQANEIVIEESDVVIVEGPEE
jgi:hypothetical protein